MKYLYILLLVFVSGCTMLDGDGYVDPNLTGHWNWVKSTGGIAGITIHSDSVDYTQTLEVKSTGEAYWYRNGELMQEYLVERGNFEDYDYNFVFTPVSQSQDSMPHMKMVVQRISRLEIELREDCADCFTHFFSEDLTQ